MEESFCGVQTKAYPLNTNYEANSNGDIFSNYTNKILNQRLSLKGYMRVDLYLNGKQKTIEVHRIIAETFLPKPNGCNTVDHINRNKLDNRVSNLRWVTNRGNQNNKKNNSIYGCNIYKTKSNKFVFKISIGKTNHYKRFIRKFSAEIYKEYFIRLHKLF